MSSLRDPNLSDPNLSDPNLSDPNLSDPRQKDSNPKDASLKDTGLCWKRARRWAKTRAPIGNPRIGSVWGGARWGLIALTLLAAAQFQQASMAACPFCPSPTKTLNEQLVQSDYAALGQFVAATKPEGDDRGSAEFELLRLVRNARDVLKVQQRIRVSRYVDAEPGELFLLTGKQDDVILWDPPDAITETAFNYVAQSPSGEQDWSERLRYYLKFLEFPDEKISTDAFSEFAKAPYEAVAALRDSYPREKLRKWVFEAEAIPLRHGLYGMMLGLCGEASDVERFRALVSRNDVDFRLGIDGIMGGYMLLVGEPALAVIEETKFRDQEVAFTELYAAMTALRFMWTYGTERIPRDRLRKSMRLLLDRPKLAEIVVTDLARWEDWEAVDQLLMLFEDERYGDRYSKRAIVAYLMVCEKAAAAEGADAQTRAAGQKATRRLEQLRADEPALIRDARRVLAP